MQSPSYLSPEALRGLDCLGEAGVNSSADHSGAVGAGPAESGGRLLSAQGAEAVHGLRLLMRQVYFPRPDGPSR